MESAGKTIWTLDIDGYSPALAAWTYPLMRAYADKIGADFRVITERKFPDWPVTYEKLQIHELGADNEWNIFLDADALVHPDMFDVTEFIGHDTVLHYGTDFAGLRWRYDRYFRRDGRNVSSCNWFTVASSWCIDLWEPLSDLTPEQAIDNISLMHFEATGAVGDRSHLVDDYALSRNVAKYGLKVERFVDLMQRLNASGNYLWHDFRLPLHAKIARAGEILMGWNVDPDELREGRIVGLAPELVGAL